MQHALPWTEVKTGAVVNGWCADRLPVGSRICYVQPGMDADTSRPLTKLGLGWAPEGQPEWGIDLDSDWLILFVPARPDRVED